MDLDFSEEQDMLRDTIRKLCREYCDLSVVRAMEESEKGFSSEFWNRLLESGIGGIRIEEKFGGVDLGVVDCAIVYEEMGRSLAPSPHFSSAVLSARLLSLSESHLEWLPKIASGEAILVPAWQEIDAYADVSRITTQAIRKGNNLILQGQKILVPYANSADALIVLARMEGRLAAILVPKEKFKNGLRAQENMADETLFSVSLDSLSLPEDESLIAQDIGAQWDQAMLEGIIVQSALAVGGAMRMLEMATDYAKEREQFGKPIGSFQSIAHYLADTATEVEGVRYLMYQAAWAVDNGLPFAQLALMSKLQCTAVYRRSTATGVQVHGGIGFSKEADPQLFYRRAKSQQLLNWDPIYLEERIASEIFG